MVNWCSVVLVLLELGRRALVRVVVVVGHAAVWLAWLDHAVGLEAATKLVPVNGWLIVVNAGAIVVVSTAVVHGLAEVELARHHAVLNRWEPLLIPGDLHGHSELLATLKVRLDVLSILVLEDFLWLLVFSHVSRTFLYLMNFVFDYNCARACCLYILLFCSIEVHSQRKISYIGYYNYYLNF